MIKGKGVSTGIGFGNVVIIKNEKREIERILVENIDEELSKFRKAYEDVKKDTEEMLKKLHGTELEIMEAYLMIMQDPSLIKETENTIKNLNSNAEYAIEKAFNSIIKIFENIDDEYISLRAKDIEDIKNRILAKILNEETINLSKLEKETIIVAKELTTSDTAKLDFKNIAGIITEVGGINSHSSIIARTHNIPAITRVLEATKIFRNGDNIAINATAGEIYLNPTQDEMKNLLELKDIIEEQEKELEKYKNQETKTKDGHRVELVANIGTPADVENILKNSAEGIGLFRSEFLYMDNDNFPTEEQQFDAYKKVAQIMQGKMVIIRTLDIGGDKELKYLKVEKEENPFLGYRAIRLCLDNLNIFKTQLRAILKASAYGNLAIMFPMISSVEELLAAKEIVKECKLELDNENIQYKKDIKIGIMIEIPSAALIANELAKYCDFFSIGTNDLIQYTIAVERGNEKVSNLYNKFHPSVIKLINETIKGAHNQNIICGMCGEVAGDELMIPLLIGLGLDEFSMNSNKILKARKIIRNLNMAKCKILANEILNLASAKQVEERLKKE